jgi:hypothetical protein
MILFRCLIIRLCGGEFVEEVAEPEFFAVGEDFSFCEFRVTSNGLLCTRTIAGSNRFLLPQIRDSPQFFWRIGRSTLLPVSLIT